MENEVVLEKLNSIIEPIVTELGYELYYIEFVEEDGENFLRIYIDKDSGITLEDCEKVSRPVSDKLDLDDPITESYYLEVSSPGIYRTLYTEEHLNKYHEYPVSITMLDKGNSEKIVLGNLNNFDDEYIYIKNKNQIIKVLRSQIITISLEGSKEVK